MHYSYISFKNNNNSFFIFYDVYQKNISIYINKKPVYSEILDKHRCKKTISFNYLNHQYRLDINTKYYFFKKIKYFVYEDNKLIFPLNKYIQKNWDIQTKYKNYNVSILYNDKTSSLQVKINDDIIFDTLNKIKAFEPKKRELSYDHQTFTLVKDKMGQELTTLKLKFNNRSDIYCVEDEQFIITLEKFKKNNQNLSLKNYLKTKILEIFTIPIFIDLLLILQVYVINETKVTSIPNTIILLCLFYLAFCLFVTIFYIIGFKNFKKRFKF